MKEFVEQKIINAVKKLFSGQVNELLCAMQQQMPLIEFSEYKGGSVVTPVISLVSSEQTEKERIIRLESYTLTITFKLPETAESELHCYAYSGAVGMAINENPTLCGEVDRAIITGKKYVPPIKPNCGEGWSLIITLRLTIEGVAV